jgi:hypothetical protein
METKLFKLITFSGEVIHNLTENEAIRQQRRNGGSILSESPDNTQDTINIINDFNEAFKR